MPYPCPFPTVHLNTCTKFKDLHTKTSTWEGGSNIPADTVVDTKVEFADSSVPTVVVPFCAATKREGNQKLSGKTIIALSKRTHAPSYIQFCCTSRNV